MEAASQTRGRQLLDPDWAQHTEVQRTPAFLCDAEIEQVISCAAEHRRVHASPSEESTWDTVYLQRGGLPAELAPIFRRISQRVGAADRDNWGILGGEEGLQLGDDVNARCVEFHEYSERGRRTCGHHYDSGSVFTADIMLSDSSSFEGGRMCTSVIRAKPTTATRPAAIGSHRTDKPSGRDLNVTTYLHEFEKGDLLVFLSHKGHSVNRVTSGTRLVLVIEFWEGPTCVGNHRCMGCCGESVR